MLAEETPSIGFEHPEGPVPRRHRLGVQVLFSLAMMAAVTALVGDLILRNAEYAYLSESARENNATKFELLRSALVENVVSEDLPQLETTLSQLTRRDPDIESVEVVNEVGKILFHWQRTHRPSHAHLLQFWPHDHPFNRLSGEIAFSGERFGTVTAVWDPIRADAEVDRHGTILALAILAVCFLLGLLGYLAVRLFAVGPIDRISEHLLALRRGDYEAPAVLPRFASTELRRLALSVDALGRFLVEREQHELELREAKEAAESASQAKSAFLAMMSHELRTPLNSINGFSEILVAELHGPVGDSRYKDYAGEIKASGDHLLALINDILDISKIEADKTELRLEKTHLSDVLALARRLVPDHSGHDPIEFVELLDPDLPVIMVDQLRLRQVLVNLIGNAMKFTPAGGRITVSACWDPEIGVTLEIVDTGIGIAPENLGRVLEPFVQVENIFSRGHQGTGLGLPLTKALVELHGGVFAISSEVGVGTTVRVTLPATLAVAPCAALPTATHDALSA